MTASHGSPNLPYPVSAQRRRPSNHAGQSPYLASAPRDLQFLLARARTTNLAVMILLGVAILSLLLNVRLYWAPTFRKPSTADRVPLSIRAILQPPKTSLKHMVMVPGHAIFTGCDATDAGSDEDWILESYQRKDGTVATLVKHLTKGAEIAVQDPEALLIFSGGQTRKNADLTEAISYARLAKVSNIYEQYMARDPSNPGHKIGAEFQRVTTENYALDSFQNLVFSIARFKEFTGHYPQRITIVGFSMKRRRFEEVHRAAIRWPQSAFKYVGIDGPDGMSEAAYEGERISGLSPFIKDLYGCKGTLLAKKKMRNPYRRQHPYHSSAPELEPLLEYCPNDNELFRGGLPW